MQEKHPMKMQKMLLVGAMFMTLVNTNILGAWAAPAPVKVAAVVATQSDDGCPGMTPMTQPEPELVQPDESIAPDEVNTDDSIEDADLVEVGFVPDTNDPCKQAKRATSAGLKFLRQAQDFRRTMQGQLNDAYKAVNRATAENPRNAAHVSAAKGGLKVAKNSYREALNQLHHAQDAYQRLLKQQAAACGKVTIGTRYPVQETTLDTSESDYGSYVQH